MKICVIIKKNKRGNPKIMLNLIPKPRSAKVLPGVYRLEKGAKIDSQIELPLVKNTGKADASVKILKDNSLEKEEYRLRVDENGVEISASDKAGAYYALQTLRLLGRFDEGKTRCLLLRFPISRSIHGGAYILMRAAISSERKM